MSAVLAIKVITDVAKAAQDLDKVGASSSKLGGAMRKAAVPAAAVGVAMIGAAKVASDAAGKMQESSGAVESVFKSQADAVKNYANNAAQSSGLAASEYQALAATIGSQLKNMGTPTEQLADQTNGLVQMGADLAATFGGSTSDAVAALSSLMRGEADPIERYGVSIKQADIAAQKAKMGLSGLTGEADKQATAQAMMALLTKQTAAAQGAFAKESTNAAGAQQIAAANAENAAAKFGAILLPAIVAVSQAAAAGAGFISRHTTAFQIIAGVIAGLVLIVLGYNAVMAAVPAVTAAVTAAQWLWNAAMAANPIGLIIIGIAALIVAIVLIVKHWDTVKRVALQVWSAITSAVRSAGNAIAGAARSLGSSVVAAFTSLQTGAKAKLDALKVGALAVWRGIVDGVKSLPGQVAGIFDSARSRALAAFSGLVGGIAGVISDVLSRIASIPGRLRDALSSIQPPSWLTSLGSFLGSAVTAEFTAGVATPSGTIGLATTWRPPAGFAGTSSRTSQPAPVIINVYGALDSASVARQIRDILNGDARRRGQVSINGLVMT